MKFRYLVVVALSLILAPLAAQAQDYRLAPDNIDEIISHMTLDEKTRIVVASKSASFKRYPELEATLRKEIDGVAGRSSAIPRLGIPSTIHSDGPAGLRIEDGHHDHLATAFPIASALAATWNEPLVQEIGRAIGEEFRDYGCDIYLGPAINIHRNPLCGRCFEYYSEDPVVSGRLGTATTLGVQSAGVGASLKHFAANSQETNRTTINEIVDERALREIYLKGFETVVKEADPWTVMASYNRLNGTFTQESRDLLTDILRGEWGYKGMVMSDWTLDLRNSAAMIHAGCDMFQPGSSKHMKALKAAIEDGTLSEEELGQSVRRVLEMVVKTPTFAQYKYTNHPDLRSHDDVNRRAASESLVLLKNDHNTLPMRDVHKVALFGSQSYSFLTRGTGSGHVFSDHEVSLTDGLKARGIEITDDLADVYKSHIDSLDLVFINPELGWILGIEQCPEIPISQRMISRQAEQADMAILTIGRQGGEGWDREIDGPKGFNLTELEQGLIEDICNAFHAVGKRVVVIINSGMVIETASWRDRPDGILLAWEPGCEAGNAVAEVLTGEVCPSGKLAETWARDIMDYPSSEWFPIGDGRCTVESPHKEGIWVGYRYFDSFGVPVSYPFGYGLSYTTFAYSHPRIERTSDGFKAYITVTNTGSVAGKEAVQLYSTAPDADPNAAVMPKPLHELKAFAKTALLQPGESETLQMSVTDYALSSYDETSHSWVAPKGRYSISFGASVEDIRARASYRMRTEFKL